MRNNGHKTSTQHDRLCVFVCLFLNIQNVLCLLHFICTAFTRSHYEVVRSHINQTFTRKLPLFPRIATICEAQKQFLLNFAVETTHALHHNKRYIIDDTEMETTSYTQKKAETESEKEAESDTKKWASQFDMDTIPIIGVFPGTEFEIEWIMRQRFWMCVVMHVRVDTRLLLVVGRKLSEIENTEASSYHVLDVHRRWFVYLAMIGERCTRRSTRHCTEWPRMLMRVQWHSVRRVSMRARARLLLRRVRAGQWGDRR